MLERSARRSPTSAAARVRPQAGRAAKGADFSQSSQASALASKILRREMSSNDQQRLVEESLAELQALGRSN